MASARTQCDSTAFFDHTHNLALQLAVELGLPLLAPDGVLVVWKRADVEAELEAAARAIALLGGSPEAVLTVDARLGSAGHVLVVIAKRRPTPPVYPRDPAERKRHPL